MYNKISNISKLLIATICLLSLNSCNEKSICKEPIALDCEEFYFVIDTPQIGTFIKSFSKGKTIEIDLKTCDGTLNFKVKNGQKSLIEGAFEGTQDMHIDTFFTEEPNGDLAPHSCPTYYPKKTGNWIYNK